MHLHPQRDPERAEQAGTAAVQVAVAGDHGEVRARTDNGQHGHGGDRQGFGDWGHFLSGYVAVIRRSPHREIRAYPILRAGKCRHNRYILAQLREKN
ncbi:hypothetical protein D3C72_2330810 [compost metagenome]